MTLEDLGYTTSLENYRTENNLSSFEVGRVISEHKERYIVKTISKEYEAEIIGHLRFTAQERSDFPAVGDWVAISEYDDDKVLIHHVFPRKTIIERQAVGKHGEKQIIATNIDYGFLVQAVDRDFNINRLERYLTICHTSHVEPIIILNKIDLIEKGTLEDLEKQVKERIENIPLISISNETQLGIDKLRGLIEKGKTYCLLGSSGVGKSSLLNNLAGEDLMKTNLISESTNRGRHITSHREMMVLKDGGIVIDNPGMREIGIADAEVGLEITFERITNLSKQCKFKDCTHTVELDCAILDAIEKGEIDSNLYQNYQKMVREREHYEATVAEKRKKDKDFGKMIKHFKKSRKSNKY
ncbi:ribosome small subunit-dependent GTPase A [Lewinella cohaerens]|uniref:ribosome small subunit-dependent GTPase A n=1 Tax=Lewinella cohaerens TaxID=70995 RepID=UPI00036F809A|nr:ribosome small subunit-dependent GTPase A [Lewinella cohaerens]